MELVRAKQGALFSRTVHECAQQSQGWRPALGA